jgi:hypothetical protein
LYDKKVWPADAHGNPSKKDKDGNLLAPKSTARVVTVDKPIEILIKTIPDQDMRFIFDSESLEGFAKSTDITLDLTNNGILKATNIDVKDKTKEIVSNATETVFNLAKIAAIAGEDVVELVLKKDVTVSRVIDPSSLTFNEIDGVFIAVYSDAEKAKGLFNITTPEVVISLASRSDLKSLSQATSSTLKNEAGKAVTLSGFPYRSGGAVKVSVKVDDLEVYDNYHMFAQAGGVAVIPVNAKSFSDITQGLSFSEDGSVLIRYTSKGTSTGEAISSTVKESTGSILSGLQSIEKAKIDKLKGEKDLLDAKESLKRAEIQARIDLLKKEKELIDAELALEEAKKKLQGSE